MDIAIDMGSTNTSIFVSGDGVVLREPTMIAFSMANSKKRVAGVGSEAYAMMGKTIKTIALIAPVVNGVISDAETATILLEEFLRKIFSTISFVPSIRAIVGIPTGITSEHRRIYEEVVLGAYSRIKEVLLVENALLAAYGSGLPVLSAAGGLIASIGGGCTEIATISLGNILSGCGLTLGGNLMDKAIIAAIAEKTGVKLGPKTIKTIKERIATLYKNDMSMKPAEGISVDDNQVQYCAVRASDLYTVLEPYYKRIGTAIENILNNSPPDVVSAISRRGIVVVGGGSKVSGLKEFLQAQGLEQVSIPPDPEYKAIIGAGQLLQDKEMLKTVGMK